MPASPPSFLKLAGHPLRWRILRELAQSDRKAGELTARLGLPQSLCAYHLRLLRDAGLVLTRRSAADARTTYYAADLASYADHLAAAGAALHPALAPASRPSAGAPPRRRRLRGAVPVHGQQRPLADGRGAAPASGQGAVEVASAGSQPKPLHPNAVRVMREHGIDMAGRRSKHLEEFAGQRFDYVITLCDRVREVCPEFPGHPQLDPLEHPRPRAAATATRRRSGLRSRRPG